LAALAIKLNAPMAERHPDYPLDFINKITRNIHITLQTEMILNACVSAEESSSSAKRACIWAVVAAGVSFLGTIATCVTIFKK
jgi:hypothetical protein